jgi:hypothetical protein
MKPESIESESGKAVRCKAWLADWSQVPKGLCLVRMFHERSGKHCLHLHLKLNDGPWYDQPHVPTAYSQEATKDSHREFWEWAEKSMPIYNYPEVVRGHA